MRYRRLGGSGLWVSALTVGSAMATGPVDYRSGAATDPGDAPERFVKGVQRAIDAGITTFDTASAYGAGRAEELLGQAIAGHRRDGLVLITKVFFPTGPTPNERGLSRKHIFASLHGSLRRLDTDHVDVYLAHRFDDQTPLAETMSAFADLVHAGKAHYIGVSGWTAAQLSAAAEFDLPLVCNQEIYHLLDRTVENEMAPRCAELGVSLMACAPLAGGLLTGKYRADAPAPTGTRGAGAGAGRLAAPLADADLLTRIGKLAPLAAAAGLTMPALAVAWALSRPSVAAAVIGLTQADQLDDLLPAAETDLDESLTEAVDDVLSIPTQ